MLGYVALLFMLYLSLKLGFTLNRHLPVMRDNELSTGYIRALQFSPLLYIVSLVSFTLPFSRLAWLSPMPFCFVILIPGIYFGYRVANKLDHGGTHMAADASRVASNIMWLGIGAAIYIAGNIVIVMLMRSGNQIAY